MSWLMAFRTFLARLQARTLRRRKVLPKAKALILDAQGQVLLIRHPQEGLWRLPGGFVEMDESAYAAVVRAVRALTGLTLLDPRPIARVDESRFRPDAMYGDFFQMYATLFWSAHWQGTAHPASPPWEVAFFPQGALPRHLHPEVALALEALEAFRATGQVKVY